MCLIHHYRAISVSVVAAVGLPLEVSVVANLKLILVLVHRRNQLVLPYRLFFHKFQTVSEHLKRSTVSSLRANHRRHSRWITDRYIIDTT